MGNYVITIGREFESLGRDVGLKLSETLGIKCYDKELLSRAAKESGLCEEIFHSQDEKPTSSFLYSLVMDTYSATGYTAAPFLDMPLNHKIFLAQFDTIKKLAEEESCIIVGRCADYVLEGTEGINLVRIFLYADLDYRIRRITRLGYYDSSDVVKNIKRMDKERRDYYRYYTGRSWEHPGNYDLTVNTGSLDIDDTVALITHYLELKGYL